MGKEFAKERNRLNQACNQLFMLFNPQPLEALLLINMEGVTPHLPKTSQIRML
jgi:hypothetical protein